MDGEPFIVYNSDEEGPASSDLVPVKRLQDTSARFIRKNVITHGLVNIA
jgi:hypothetical protein